jgi:hypothetical protein
MKPRWEGGDAKLSRASEAVMKARRGRCRETARQ